MKKRNQEDIQHIEFQLSLLRQGKICHGVNGVATIIQIPEEEVKNIPMWIENNEKLLKSLKTNNSQKEGQQKRGND